MAEIQAAEAQEKPIIPEIGAKEAARVTPSRIPLLVDAELLARIDAEGKSAPRSATIRQLIEEALDARTLRHAKLMRAQASLRKLGGSP